MKQYDLFDYRNKIEDNLKYYSFLNDDIQMVECPWCYGLTYHTHGETDNCTVCRIEISDSDILARVD